MNLFRTAIKSHVSVRRIKPIHALPSFLRESPKCFCTGTDQPQQPPQPDASVHQFLDSADKGFVYGSLQGFSKYSMKSDIINLLEGANLTPDDIKINYNRNFLPFTMMLRFSSPAAFSNAAKVVRRFNRLYKLEKADASDWDIIHPYNGKTVVLSGLPRHSTAEEVERFLGCDCDFSSIEMVTLPRPGNAPSRIATVQFPSQVQAMNAFITKNRSIFLNFPITLRVLY
ncbi:hypothetical protein CCACVL1_17663 [Corchorus capsularis]|uniref:RRM domain-containing protein n=1 Tax=Corchorus capsularis TaxID=210143 RepID=A0A1R3HQI2_COCAP|nr:hypothetical protein CCACVL1_17663 [Corchorus capsularis]